MRVPQFTIRDLLWLMVVVGMGVVLWMDRSRIHRLHSELDRREGQLGELSRAVWESGYDPRETIRPSAGPHDRRLVPIKAK